LVIAPLIIPLLRGAWARHLVGPFCVTATRFACSGMLLFEQMFVVFSARRAKKNDKRETRKYRAAEGSARTQVILSAPPEGLVSGRAAVNSAAGQAGYARRREQPRRCWTM
jgi:hypothetical protein